jgi:OPT family oligopeptide transporter
VVAFWIVVPGLYYSNVWYTAYLPLMTADLYDNTGAVYNVSNVMNADGTFNQTGYEAYSPPFLPATFSFVYGISFAALTAVPVHIYLWHGEDIWKSFKGRTVLDIHGRLMRVYKRTPWYWYGALTLVIFILSIVVNEVYDTKLPVYGVLLAVIIPAIYMIPCGIIQGITNVDANQLNVLSEFIGGYMFSGKPLANMIFKVLSTDVVGQVISQELLFGDFPLMQCIGLVLCTRHEAWPLFEDPTSYSLLCSRECYSKSLFLSTSNLM